jgi:cbb3-type cytochrome oxidase maturation protein
MLESLTLGAFVVALLMSLAALMAFVWGVTAGAFTDVERVKYQVLSAEGIAHER